MLTMFYDSNRKKIKIFFCIKIKNITRIFFCAFVFVFAGCIAFTNPYKYTVERKTLKKKNPTSYVFNYSVSEIKRKIIDKYEKTRFYDRNTYGHLDLYNLSEKLHYLKDSTYNKSEYKNDIFLLTEDFEGVQSKVYFSKEEHKSLPYIVDFLIHFVPIEERKTKVDIITFYPRVRAGMTSGFFNPHGPANVYEDVEPTSIEEYYILLTIGKELGEKDMPMIILPQE